MGIDILRNSHIRYTQMGSLNDPFESNPLFEETSIREWCEAELPHQRNELLGKKDVFDAIFREIAGDTYDSAPPEFKRFWSRSQFLDEARSYWNRMQPSGKTAIQEKLDKRLQEYLPLMPMKILRKIPLILAEYVCVLSLSKIRDSVKMWGVYAGGCTGLVVGFDGTNEFFDKLLDVQYSTQREMLSFPRRKVEDLSEGERMENFRRFVGTKSEIWREEMECRLLALPGVLKSTGVPDQLGYPVLVRDFPLSMVSEVIAGYRMHLDDHKMLTRVLQEKGYENILHRAKLHDDTYTLVIEKDESVRQN